MCLCSKNRLNAPENAVTKKAAEAAFRDQLSARLLVGNQGKDACFGANNFRATALRKRLVMPRSGMIANQRWRALKRGLLLQITNTLPRRRTTLQSRCRCLADFREESTFTAGSSVDMWLKQSGKV